MLAKGWPPIRISEDEWEPKAWLATPVGQIVISQTQLLSGPVASLGLRFLTFIMGIITDPPHSVDMRIKGAFIWVQYSEQQREHCKRRHRGGKTQGIFGNRGAVHFRQTLHVREGAQWDQRWQGAAGHQIPG